MISAIRGGGFLVNDMHWIVIAALALGGCDQRPDEWSAFVYPDRGDLTTHVEMRGFKTFDQCQTAAMNVIRGFGYTDRADYECGHKCEPRPDLGDVNICKETRR